MQERKLWNENNTSTILETVLQSRAQKALVVYLARTMEKIRHAAGRKTVDELVNILHGENFSPAVLNGFVKWSRDCVVITQEAIIENNDF